MKKIVALLMASAMAAWLLVVAALKVRKLPLLLRLNPRLPSLRLLMARSMRALS